MVSLYVSPLLDIGEEAERIERGVGSNCQE